MSVIDIFEKHTVNFSEIGSLAKLKLITQHDAIVWVCNTQKSYDNNNY